MKKIFIVFMAILILCVPVMSASAGAPKIGYEIGETFTEATIKAVQARKGFKVVEGTVDEVKPSEVFTDSIKKGLQDTAMESWEVINGGKFDKTPLKGMPGWFKVTLGTAAFVTGADIAFDIYEKIAGGEEIDFLTPSNQRVKSLGDIYIDYTYEYDVHRYGLAGPEGERFSYKIDDIESGSSYSKTVSWTGFIINVFESPLRDKRDEYKTALSRFNDMYIAFEVINTKDDTRSTYFIKSDISRDTAVNTDSVKLPVSSVSYVPVSPVDDSKETQTIIVPDPAVFPDIDKAINDNWDMVADPEKWLEENPENDPDIEVPPPVEEPETPPVEMPEPLPKPEPLPVETPEVPTVDTDIGWLQKIWEAIVSLPVRVWNSAIDFLVPTDPAPIIEIVYPLKEEMTSKFNSPSDFTFLKTAIADKGDSCPQDIKAFGAVIVEFDYVCDKAKWFRPIMIGFVYFLFGWWLFRKANALMAKNGGIQ